MSLIVSSLSLSGCSQGNPQDVNDSGKPSLTIFSGITMVKPLTVLAKEFEQLENIDIHIEQGASGYLYRTLRSERKGDIYFPGSANYRIQYQDDKLLLDRVFVGFNRLTLVVAHGNPKHLTNDLKQLTNTELSVVLASPDSSAVGKATSQLLHENRICEAVFENVTYFTTDSYRLFSSIEKGHADMTINWFATTQWEENRDKITPIPLPANLEIKDRLELNLLSFSKQPKLAKKFMQYVGSKHGLQTFANYGFLTEEELALLIENPNAFAE